MDKHCPKTLKLTLDSLFEDLELRGWNVYASLDENDPTKVVLHFKSRQGVRPPPTNSSKYRRMNDHQQQRDANRAARKRRRKQKASSDPKPHALNVQAPEWSPEGGASVLADDATVTPTKVSVSVPAVQSVQAEGMDTSVTAASVAPTGDSGDQIATSKPDATSTLQHKPIVTPKKAKVKKPIEYEGSPPATINGIFRCHRCRQIIGDQDEVYVCRGTKIGLILI